MRYRTFLLGAALALLSIFWLWTSAPTEDRSLGPAPVGVGVAASPGPKAPGVGLSEEVSVPAKAVPGSAAVDAEGPLPATLRETAGDGLGRLLLTFEAMPPGFSPKDRPLGRVRLTSVDTKGLVDLKTLRGSGGVEFDRLEAGSYLVDADERASFRFPTLPVEIVEGQTVEREIVAEFRRPVEFRVRASLASSGDPGSESPVDGSCEIFALPESADDRERVRRKSSRSTRMGRDVSIELEVFSGPITWEGRYRGKRGRPVVPALSAQVEVLVPEPGPDSERATFSGFVPETIDVALRFGGRSSAVAVKGVIGNDRHERSGGIEVVGSSVSGEDFAEVLAIREDGGFFFQAELDRLSGPQVYLRSKGHQDLLGPFVLGPGANDLGELRFSSRLTQAEENERMEELEDVRARGRNSRYFRR
ncbi:hypothetical protein Poly30_40150 [Planctomycetes bacterium Poly30]|uniref:Uncharacterized protein n=1 Tax=Saltatorellus ferox TaxID=2528018 RepID=A0A518EWL8_9BACT|nr:hypothetical protein Poly30_40150 [Planctomycetes bacterium Poly30]